VTGWVPHPGPGAARSSRRPGGRGGSGRPRYIDERGRNLLGGEVDGPLAPLLFLLQFSSNSSRIMEQVA
jgi:hypothetical protein